MCRIGSHCPTTTPSHCRKNSGNHLVLMPFLPQNGGLFCLFVETPTRQWLAIPVSFDCWHDDKYEFLLFLKTYNSCCCSCSPGSAPGGHGLARWQQRVDDPRLIARISSSFSYWDVVRMRRWYLRPGYHHRIYFKFLHSRRKNMKFIFWWCVLKGWKLFGVVFHVPVWWPARQHVSFMDLRNFCLKNWSISEVGAQGYQTEGTSCCGSSNLQLGHIGSRLLIVNNPNLAKITCIS